MTTFKESDYSDMFRICTSETDVRARRVFKREGAANAVDWINSTQKSDAGTMPRVPPQQGKRWKREHTYIMWHQAEVLKRSGNESFLTCCAAADDARRRDLAADAAIFYLDVLDVLHTAEQVPATPDQAGALRELTLATLLNRAAALNKQDEWRLSLRATNRALKLDAANVKGLYRRAVALAGLGRHDDAEGDLNRVLAAAPENKDAQRKLLAVRAAAAAKKAEQARVPRAAASAKHKPPREKLAIEVAIEAERAAMERDYDAANAAADAAHRALTPRDGNVAEEAPAPSPSKSLLEPFAPYGTAVAAPPKAGGAPFDPFDILGPDGTKDRAAEEEATPRPNLTTL